MISRGWLVGTSDSLSAVLPPARPGTSRLHNWMHATRGRDFGGQRGAARPLAQAKTIPRNSPPSILTGDCASPRSPTHDRPATAARPRQPDSARPQRAKPAPSSSPNSPCLPQRSPLARSDRLAGVRHGTHTPPRPGGRPCGNAGLSSSPWHCTDGGSGAHHRTATAGT